jgi:mRNA interferase MazF
VNDDAIGALPLRVIVPLTEWRERYAEAPWMVHVGARPGNGLGKDSAADAFQVRSVARERFVRRLGRVSDMEMSAIGKALALVLRIEG